MTGERHRALAVLCYDPWPVRSGITRRLDAVVRALADTTDLTVLICDVSGGATPPDLKAQVVRERRDSSKLRSLVEVVRGARALRPVTAAFFVRPQLRRTLAAVVERVQPDLVFTHGIGGAELIEGLVPPERVVFDADTIDPDTYRRIARDSRGVTAVQWGLDARLLPRWHRTRLPRYRTVAVVSPEDLALYPRLAPGARLVQVPNGVDLPVGPRTSDPDGPLLYVGALHYPPNAAAVDWLASDVLPLLPDSRLRVVGEGDVPAHDRIEQVGFVPDLAAVWAEASALLVPLRSGGGTRLKVLEAFAHGLPVVSTTFGVEGLSAVDGVHYLRAETAADFATQVGRLRQDLALRNALCAGARELVESFTWKACTAPLVEAFR